MQPRNRGLLISFEGIDGAGKSTLIAELAARLLHDGHTIVSTKEPGGTPVGRLLKKVLLEEEKSCDPRVEFLLFAADRAEHHTKVIVPALEQGAIILCDRMADSAIAYQGYGRGLACSFINSVNAFAMRDLSPDATFYLAIDPKIACARQDARGKKSSMEQTDLDFWYRVTTGYERLAEQESRFIRLDATLTPTELCNLAYEKIHSLLNARRDRHDHRSSSSNLPFAH